MFLLDFANRSFASVYTLKCGLSISSFYCCFSVLFSHCIQFAMDFNFRRLPSKLKNLRVDLDSVNFIEKNANHKLFWKFKED